MPLTPFSQENKVKTNTDYPKLVLDYKERALVIFIEPAPVMEYRHTLKAPEIGPDGKVLKEIRDGKGGRQFEVAQTEFIGQHLCFGNFDVLQRAGVDPEACPTCAAAVEGNGIDPPKEYYAMNIIRYALKANSWELKDPFSVECVAWVFSGTRFNQIVDLAADWDDLRKHDVKLGPCENAQFQKYDINVIQKAEWLQSKERKELVAQEYANNKCPDLSALCARKVDRSSVLEDIARVQERYAQAYGITSSPVLTQSATQAVDSDIAALLGDDVVTTDSNDSVDEEPIIEGGSIFDPTDSEPMPTPKKSVKKQKVEKVIDEDESGESADLGSMDMDEILNLLN